MEAEKSASVIISDARDKAGARLAAADSELSDKLNKFRAEELERFNQEVEKAASDNINILEKIKTSEEPVNIDLEAVSNEVLNRILTTVFD